SPLRSIEANNSFEDLATNEEVTASKRKGISNRTNVKKMRENEEHHLTNSDDERTSSSLIRSHSPEDFDNQQPLASNATTSLLVKNHSPESAYSQRSSSPNVDSSPLTKNYSFEDTNDQHSSISNTINDSSSSLIGPFKSDLEVCLYLVQHPDLINLTLNMIKAGGQGSIITQAKADKFNILPEIQISEYITDHNWTAFLKRHMDVLDIEKTFKKRPENVVKFTNFIRSAFNLFVKESLLDKDVISEVKDLNYMTVDMIIFTADGKDSLQQLDLNSINNEDYSGESLQESFSEESQHDNDFECSFTMASDTLSNESDILSSESDMLSNESDILSSESDILSSESDILSSSDQLTIMEGVERQSEVRIESTQTIVDSGINFQP
ncbi:17741_t:CDS:2, partial [Racocetra fulgida]